MTTTPLLRPRRYEKYWWTTSKGSTFLPTQSSSSGITKTSKGGGSGGPSSMSTSGAGQASATPPATASSPSSIPDFQSSPALASSSPVASLSGSDLTSGPITFTSSVLTIITQPSTTFTSSLQTVVTTTISTPTQLPSPSPLGALQVRPVCIGDGIDALAYGALATLLLPSAVGLILWLLFAIIRPRYRQLYALREWFISPELRPKPLSSSFWAFLFPHVPLVPSIPKDVSDAGRTPAGDAHLFPSDEQLGQRTLWISFLIVLGWTLLGLGGALPLYLVSTPCLAQSIPPSQFGGVYSTLQDLSLLRLLHLLDNGSVTTENFNGLHRRETVNGKDLYTNTYIRLIVLTALVLGLAVPPALWKILKEFNKMVAYRKRWIQVKCEGREMAWLSAKDATGFAGWGEKKLKKFLVKSGLSSMSDPGPGRNGNRRGIQRSNGDKRRPEDEADQPLTSAEEADLDVDIESLFSIGDTQRLALLIDNRDEILENLEIAETRYIASFRLSTPDPSIADFQMQPIEENKNRPYISHPRALAGVANNGRRRRRRQNPAYGGSSLAPTSFVAPSQYYKLRGVRGISGGKFADTVSQPSLSDSIHQRVVGSRFQEVNRNSQLYGRLPMGSHVRLEKSGELGPASPPLSQETPRQGPSFDQQSWIQSDSSRFLDSRQQYYESPQPISPEPKPLPSPSAEDEWVDLVREAPIEFPDDSGIQTQSRSTPAKETYDEGGIAPPRRRIPKIFQNRQTTEDSGKRETFPLRNRHKEPEGDPELVPPHLRLQQRAPFVRPVSGLNHDDLGLVYGDISQWRTKLKTINVEIEDAQRSGYNDIAVGSNIKGWIMVGRGLRFIPGTQLIEGRAKEDVRWDILQNERSSLDSIVLWTVIAIVVVALAAGLTAVSGLALANAPNFGHYIPFLQPVANGGGLTSGLATALAPAVAATVFITIALAIVNWATGLRGTVSISSGQLLVFKLTFFILTVVAVMWLIAIGALLFGAQSFSADTSTSQTVANGSIYVSAFAMVLVLNVAVIFPALLMLQPVRLWRLTRAEKEALTPRQGFRALYPRTYNPTFATGACVLAIVFASTFSLIFPLIGPAVVVLLFLTLVAHRYLVGYVYARTHSQTGGLVQIWLLHRFATILAFQPTLLGLILLSRRLWILGGVLTGVALGLVVAVEIYCNWKTKLPGTSSLNTITRYSLNTFASAARTSNPQDFDDESTTPTSTARGHTRARGSMASILDMMSLTLAVEPSPSQQRGPVPLRTETLDDLTATERAARTHPDAPPHLPPLAFTDHAEDMSGILYAPELIAPPPTIWLPNDSAGVARAEVYDLEKFHGLPATLDVRSQEDVAPRVSESSRHRHPL